MTDNEYTDDSPVEKVDDHEDQDTLSGPVEDEHDEQETEEAIDAGEVDDDVYTKEGRDQLVEDDEIDTAEEGFSKGAEPDKHGQ
jgi:hypothetical protein